MIVGAVTVGCTSSGQTTEPTTTIAATPPTTAVDSGQPTDGGRTGPKGILGVRLSPGEPSTTNTTTTPLVDGTALEGADVDQIVGRLPQWADGSLGEEFRWPTASLVRPQTGTTVDVAFPAAETSDPPPVETGPLQVVRYQPEGEVTIAPFVTITFDQPMVPLATLGQLDAADVPATISPAIDGRWQWIGTRTLRFDANSDTVDRLPMATEYRVEVPAGTRSAAGTELAEAVSFEFATPPVTVDSLTPTGDNLALTPVFVAGFDQRVDQAAVLATVTLDADGERRQIRLATEAEIEADEIARQRVGQVPEGRWLAFRAVDPLPTDAPIEIEISPGTPSAEGPLTTTEAAGFSARTYPPLRVTDVGCDYGAKCPPGTSLSIWFNNPLDLVTFDPGTIRIDPPIEGKRIDASGTQIYVSGATVARTDYRITIPAGLRDEFGQTLAEDDEREISIGEATEFLQQFPLPLTTLDPLADQPTISVRSVNHDQLRVRVFEVEPSDWPRYIAYATQLMNGAQDQPALPGWTSLADDPLDTGGSPDRLTETPIDLSDELDGAHGHLVVLVEPDRTYTPNSELYWTNRPTITWVQSTAIALDGFTDHDQLHVWATDLATGSPLSGVTTEFIGDSGDRSATTATDADGLSALTLDPIGKQLVVGSIGDDERAAPARLLRRSLADLGPDRPAALVRVRRPPDLPPGRDDLGQGLGPSADVQRRLRAAAAGQRGERQLRRPRRAVPRDRFGCRRAQPARRVRPDGRSAGRRQPRLRDDRPDPRRRARARLDDVLTVVPDRGVPPPRVRGHRPHRG